MPEWEPTPKRIEKLRVQIRERISAVDNEQGNLIREIIEIRSWKPDDWEHGFIQSISCQVARGKTPLSEKQAERLREMLDNAREREEELAPRRGMPRSARAKITGEAMEEGMRAMDLWFKDPMAMTILKASAYEALVESLEVVSDRAGKLSPKIQVLEKWYFVRSEPRPTQDQRYRWLDVWIEEV